MDLPKEATPEWIAKNIAEFERAIPEDHRQDPKLQSVVLSGIWLQERFIEAGASPDDARQAAFAHGQISATTDPWLTAQKMVERYRETGRYPKPGLDLSATLLQMNGVPSGTIHILRGVMKKLGYTALDTKEKREKALKMLDEELEAIAKEYGVEVPSHEG